MNATAELDTVFSIFHDGSITEWKGDRTFLRLTVQCRYLAERIKPSFEVFYVDLHDVDHLEFDPWLNYSGTENRLIYSSPADVFQTELEILSADIDEDKVVITCNVHDTDAHFSGGYLSVGCKKVKIYDEENNEITLDALGEICEAYWNDFANK